MADLRRTYRLDAEVYCTPAEHEVILNLLMEALDFYSPAIGSTLQPWCVEHNTAYEWRDGTPLPHYADGFAPVGWVCPCDPGHPASDAQGGTQ